MEINFTALKPSFGTNWRWATRADTILRATNTRSLFNGGLGAQQTNFFDLRIRNSETRIPQPLADGRTNRPKRRRARRRPRYADSIPTRLRAPRHPLPPQPPRLRPPRLRWALLRLGPRPRQTRRLRACVPRALRAPPRARRRGRRRVCLGGGVLRSQELRRGDVGPVPEGRFGGVLGVGGWEVREITGQTFPGNAHSWRYSGVFGFLGRRLRKGSFGNFVLRGVCLSVLRILFLFCETPLRDS